MNGRAPQSWLPEHAAFYGLRHEVVYREITTPDGRRVRQSLTEHIEQRGKWPDAARRYCTVICANSASWIMAVHLVIKDAKWIFGVS